MAESIMIVDDDRNICAITKVYLQKNGYEVTTVYSGTEALKEAEEGACVETKGSQAAKEAKGAGQAD